MGFITSQFVNRGWSTRVRSHGLERVKLQIRVIPSAHEKAAPISAAIQATRMYEMPDGTTRVPGRYQTLHLDYAEAVEFCSKVGGSVSKKTKIQLASSLLKDMSDAEIGRVLRGALAAK